jgi:hypothetical protein
MPYPDSDLIEAVRALPVERQNEVREFIGLLDKRDDIVAVAMAWITEHLPDRYCAGEARFDVRTFNWHVPVLLSYPSGKGGKVGELAIDAITNSISNHTPLQEIRDHGRKLARELLHDQ